MKTCTEDRNVSLLSWNGEFDMIYASLREDLSLGFSTRSDTNTAVQLQKMAGDLKLQNKNLERFY